MKITQLRYFCEVCRLNNISRAAENLYVSQSAVSISIRELETEFDTPLFIRNNNRLTLTEAGQKLWECAEKILDQVEETRKIMADIHDQHSVIRLALAPSCVDYVVPLLDGVIRRIREKYPNVEIRIREVRVGEGVQLLFDNEADIALMSFAKEMPSELGWSRLYSNRLKICVSREHPFADLKKVRWNQLNEEPLVLTDALRTALRSLSANGSLAKYHLRLNFKFVFSQPDTLERLVERNYGIGIVAPGVFMPKSDRIRILDIEEAVPFDLGVFWNKNVVMKNEVIQLKNMICSRAFTRKIQENYELKIK